jgi:hypothetical protein
VTEPAEPWVDLGDGITATASELLARCIQRGSMASFQDVLDEIIVERRGRLGVGRRVRRWLRHAFRKPAAAAEPLAPPTEIADPRPIADSADIFHAAWAGDGIVGYTRPPGARCAVVAWATPDAPARRVVELPGIMNDRPSPRGERIALHVLYHDRPGGGWCADFSGCLVLDLATGELRTLLESTIGFELSGSPSWSSDGCKLALGGVDRRWPAPLPTSIRVLDAASGRSLASIERRDSLRPLRFDGDAVIVEIYPRLYRWLPGTTELVDEPGAADWPRYAFASGEQADVLDEHADGRLLLKHAGQLAWSRRGSSGSGGSQR